MNIEFKETQVIDAYNIENYIESGFYITNNNEVMFINKASMLCNFICFKYDLPDINQNTKAELTESFVLKLVSIASKNEKFKEL